jgi:hypothetical protein
MIHLDKGNQAHMQTEIRYCFLPYKDGQHLGVLVQMGADQWRHIGVAVGIVTRLRVRRFGVRNQVGRYILHPPRRTMGSTQPPANGYRVSFPGYNGQGGRR